MFTILAKGGAPSGHTCPNSTMAFKATSIIKIRVFGLFMVGNNCNYTDCSTFSCQSIIENRLLQIQRSSQAKGCRNMVQKALSIPPLYDSLQTSL